MGKFILAAVAAIFLSAFSFNGAQAKSDLITKSSSFDVKTTMDRLEAVFKKKGVTVFARVNHAAGAMKIGAKLAPTELIIFGNPKLGTPLMQSNRAIGIDLPLKALVWKDAKGTVWLSYNNPEYLAERHHIKDRGKVFTKMAGVLKKLTDAAVKP